MTAQVERLVSTGLSRPGFLGRASAWLSAKWKAHRDRMIEKEAIAYLRSLDRSVLEDIGVDVNNLKANATFAQGNPHILAISALMAPPPSDAEHRQK